jgi:glycosyltransferase involved in cell wall biosynthesis/nucleotide-binding universal stress UspA family protein
MKKRYRATIFQKILVPIVHGADNSAAIAAACAISGGGQILLVGMVHIPEGESLSHAAVPARLVRKMLREFSQDKFVSTLEHVRASHQPWAELTKIVEEENVDLLVIDWPHQLDALQMLPDEALTRPPCNLALVCGSFPQRLNKLLLPIRGGPYAELALRLSLSISRSTQAEITSLHLSPPDASSSQDAPYRGIDRVLTNLTEVDRQVMQTNDAANAILGAAPNYDLVVVGATARTAHPSIGPVAERLMGEISAPIIVVKSKRSMPANLESQVVGQTAISILVDKWFAENTYHADEFSDLEHLLRLKRQQNLTISLALPALNEEETVGNVIQTIKAPLMEQVALLDEIVLVDSNSTDQTRQIGTDLGIPVYIHQQILPQYGARVGKGEALWKSLYLTRGDLLLWIDTDILNIRPGFLYGLIGPLLARPNIQFIKGFYRRPLKINDKLQAGGGGRVTELTARPLINLFYPELSGVIQPLSGEYGGRRSALEQLPFYSGYGVEIGLLIDVFEKFGLNAIAQVDLMERIHKNQPLESLSKMSFAIIQAVFHKLEKRYGINFLEDVNKTMKLIHYEPGRFSLDIEEIAEKERPPMSSLTEYQMRFLENAG